MKNLSKKFESLAAFSAWLENSAQAGQFKNDISPSSDSGSKDFTETENYQTANDLMRHGWKEGAERVKAVMIKRTGAMAERPRLYNSVVGFVPNVPNYVMGHPLNMINRKSVKVPARVLDLVYFPNASGNVESSDIEETAAKVFNIITGLEKSGVRVNLFVAFISRGTNDKQQINLAVKIKSANQPFNLLKMVYPCVHPSFLRRHCFRLVERIGVTSGFSGYGHPIYDKSELNTAFAALGLSAAKILTFADCKDKTEKEIAEMIK